MQPDRVIKAFQVLENGGTRLSAALERRSAETLALKSGEERFHRRVIIAIACPTHADLDAGLAKHGLIAVAGKLTAPVGMMQESGRGTPLCQSHTQGEFGQ